MLNANINQVSIAGSNNDSNNGSIMDSPADSIMDAVLGPVYNLLWQWPKNTKQLWSVKVSIWIIIVLSLYSDQ